MFDPSNITSESYVSESVGFTATGPTFSFKMESPFGNKEGIIILGQNPKSVTLFSGAMIKITKGDYFTKYFSFKEDLSLIDESNPIS